MLTILDFLQKNELKKGERKALELLDSWDNGQDNITRKAFHIWDQLKVKRHQ
jgi:hypothetical protein